jgi:hypothetical protein
VTGITSGTSSPPAASARKLRLDPQEAVDLAAILSSPDEQVTVQELEAALDEGALDELSPEAAAEILATWFDDPAEFVRATFRPRPTRDSPDGIDAWQHDVLDAVTVALRIALKACKGPGKSCVLAWVIWWFLVTRPHANVVVTSITRENLRDGLWKELAKWYARSPYLQRVFSFTAERIAAREAPLTWWCSARGWAKDADPEQQANTMAGLHGEHVMVVHDEVSDYPDGVLAASEGIFQTADQEAKLLVAGNPTRQDGPLYRICTQDRRLWSPPLGRIVEITGDPDDPKRSPRISLSASREAIRQHGREHPWVMTNVLGLFPKVAFDKLLGPNEVLRAVNREIPLAHYVHEPKVFGVDVAWEGDDQSVLVMRQGAVVFVPKAWRNLEDWELADQVALLVLKHGPVRVYVDGIGIGHGVVSHLRQRVRGRCEVVDVQAGESPADPRYLNLRAEMWHRMRDAVKLRLRLPDHAQLRADLCGPKRQMKDGGGHTFKVALESKKDMKKRGLPSPDFGDALAMTFAWPDPLTKRGEPLDEELEGLQSHAVQTFDPLA